MPGSVHVTTLGPHGAPPVLFVHGSTSWGDDPHYGFAAQAPLAGRFRLLLMDRRGYGGSPDAGESFPGDYLADDDDIAELPELTPEQWLQASVGSTGSPPPEASEPRLRAAGTALRERVCWEAAIPLPALRAAAFPKLVISGTWESAPEQDRERGGVPFMACARITAERVGGRHASVPGAGHWPHVEAPETLNGLLAELWHQAA
ncbi:alpha/beta hydrolase [Nonomuraea mesophila]|uniref:Alpha/beta hydrolase n=1 Tax=Nonomuraea mesophila TaxID=2530382 RepID=A0A4R5E4R2_9ACTN|nr:alpha/beta hydrolase [Nonomuraea mesophila]